jgi:LAO/AO transport system kinase
MARARASQDIHQTAEQVRAGDRRALARAITLVESARPSDRPRAEDLLNLLLPDTGRAIRIGISGAPGVGKSTFIEAFGAYVTGEGHRLAVLAIDPSSRRSGGSILGDKTRMESLARNPGAFIRPSPAGTTLGGVARRTREAMLVTEAAGFDVVLVETVGVGQSETAVADMVDVFVLLISPGGGDELQGIKRGVMELADIVIVTKADGVLKEAAVRAAADYAHALHMMRPKYSGSAPQVLQVSSVEGRGLAEAWSAIQSLRETFVSSGELSTLRATQLRRWFWSEVHEALLEEVQSSTAARSEAERLEAAAGSGEALPSAAAREFLARFRGS